MKKCLRVQDVCCVIHCFSGLEKNYSKPDERVYPTSHPNRWLNILNISQLQVKNCKMFVELITWFIVT